MEATRRCWRTASAWPAERCSTSRRTGSTPPPADSTPAGDRNDDHADPPRDREGRLVRPVLAGGPYGAHRGDAAGYWLPGRGRAATTDYDIEGTHFAERCQVFIIIALGESIVVTGATASEAGLTPTVVLCLVVAFVQTAAAAPSC
jgi:hypothetical protein